MYLVDFIYDDIQLSNLGCMVGSAVTSNNDSIVMGSPITLNTVKNRGNYLSEIVDANYEDVYTCQFDIVKKPCDSKNEYFSDNEITWFMRWLNRKDYNKFKPIYDEDEAFYKLYLMGTFTEVQSIQIGGHVIGFALTFVANSSFGYLEYFPTTFDVNANEPFTFFDESEELGVIYPNKFIIKCEEYGKLVISNSMEPLRLTEIDNCVSGEIITLDCIHRVIESSVNHPKLYTDFNYIYPRLKNTLTSRENIFTSSLQAVITIDYHPIRKVGVIV